MDRSFPLFFFCKFIYLFLERESTGKGQRERERENPKQALHCQLGPWCGAQTHKTVRSWPELKTTVGCLTDWATQVPHYVYLFWKRETEKESVSKEGQRQRGREREREKPKHRAWYGAWTHKTVRSWPELKPRVRGLTDWATQVPLTLLMAGSVMVYQVLFWYWWFLSPFLSL